MGTKGKDMKVKDLEWWRLEREKGRSEEASKENNMGEEHYNCLQAIETNLRVMI